MPQESAARLSQRISEWILQWDACRKAEAFYFYYPLGNEVSLIPVIEKAFAENMPCAFPKVTGKQMDFFQVSDFKMLEKGTFGVMEPQAASEPVHWEHALCFVPGVVFDKKGGRFGYGGGYYDRYLAAHGTLKTAGCAYGCQVVEKLPTDAWDRHVDYLITEDGICGLL